MNELEKRLRELMSEHGLRTLQELADFSGVSKGLVGQWFSGQTGLGKKPLLNLVKKTSFSAQWIADGTGSKYQTNLKTNQDEAFPRPASSRDFAIIPQYSAHKDDVTSTKNLFDGLAFSYDWLERMEVKEKNLCTIYAKNNSMFPTISDKDVVMIDTSQVTLKEGQVFVINREGSELVIKRVAREKDGGWIFQSDNSEKTVYKDMYPLQGDIIIGRVVWIGSNGGL